jgi:hypothetical protein
MPQATDILDGLSAIANQATAVAVAWHIAVATALVVLASGWRPSRRTARLLIGTPLASVAGVAVVFDNPFNGSVFAATALATTVLAMIGDRSVVSPGSPWTRGIGVAMIAFAWVYPHFLEGDATAYLYASPVGLIPCPTLAMAIGFALLGNGLGSPAWSLTLAAVGLFYGLFGVLRLGVFLDIGLVGGALALAAAPEVSPFRNETLLAARAFAVWLLLIAAEVAHGIVRTLVLTPAVGDFRARQIGVFTGSLLILLITAATIRWICAGRSRTLVMIGGVWVALTVAFEIGLGRMLGYSWERLASDYKLSEGGLLPIGLAIMAVSPLIAARLRGIHAMGR